MKKSPLKKRSSAQAKRDRIIGKMKREIHERSPFCSGCGRPGPIQAFDYSHIIGKGQRPDLYTEPGNGVLDCRSCHVAWGGIDMDRKMSLLNFWDRVEYIRIRDPYVFAKHYEGLKRQNIIP